MKNTKKILASILSFTLIVTLIPFTAFNKVYADSVGAISLEAHKDIIPEMKITDIKFNQDNEDENYFSVITNDLEIKYIKVYTDDAITAENVKENPNDYVALADTATIDHGAKYVLEFGIGYKDSVAKQNFTFDGPNVFFHDDNSYYVADSFTSKLHNQKDIQKLYVETKKMSSKNDTANEEKTSDDKKVDDKKVDDKKVDDKKVDDKKVDDKKADDKKVDDKKVDNKKVDDKKVDDKKADDKTPKKEFTDVTKDNWAYPAVNFVVNKGYFAGYGDNIFGANDTITKAQFVTVLGRVSKVDKAKYTALSYEDVKAGEYYTSYVEWAKENKLVRNADAKNFKPNEKLNREEMAYILDKYLTLTNPSLEVAEFVEFKDTSEFSEWAIEPIEELAISGILKGKEDGKFHPKDEFTRAQVAQVLYNIYK